MTEKQETVFRSYGLSEEDIANMKEEGMNYKQQSFADTAVIMLDYLEEKYGETFEVVGGDIPGILADEYWITAQACEGEYAGEEFDVYYGEEAGLRDGYITILKEEEACKAFKNLVQEQFNDVQVYAEISGEYGNELTLDMTEEQLLQTVSYAYYLIITAPDMTEEAFTQVAIEIETYLKEHEVFSSGSVFCFLNKVDLDMTANEAGHLIGSNSDTNIIYKWSVYISTH